jgi:hypothetical protein
MSFAFVVVIVAVVIVDKTQFDIILFHFVERNIVE